jgi:hypothetical protein
MRIEQTLQKQACLLVYPEYLLFAGFPTCAAHHKALFFKPEG